MLELSSMIVLLCVGVLVMVYLVMHVQKGIRSSGYTSSMQYGETVQFLHDKHDLHALGIGQYLRRKYGERSSFGISFSQLGVASTTLLLIAPIIANIGVKLALIIFPIVGLIFVLLSAVLAQLLSPFPTAGGLYYVMYAHSNSMMASVVGVLKLIAQLCSTIFYAMGCTLLIALLLKPYTSIMQQPIMPYCICIAIILLQCLYNSMKSATTRYDQWIGLLLQLGTIVLLIVAGAFFLLADSYPAITIFFSAFPASHMDGIVQQSFPMQMGLAIALLCKWFIGSEAASAAAEETYEPKIKTPWSIFQSSMYSYILGFVLLLMLSIVVFNVSIAGGVSGAMQWLSYLSSKLGTLGNLVIIVAIISCFQSGTTSVFVASRNLYALVRDQQLPFSHKLALISYTKQIPQRCIVAVSVLACSGAIAALLLSSIVQIVLIIIASHICTYLLVLYVVKPKLALGVWTIGKGFNILRVALLLPLLILLAVVGTFLPIGVSIAIIVVLLVQAIYSYSSNGMRYYNSQTEAKRSFELETKLPIQ